MEIRYSNFTDTVRITEKGMDLRLTLFSGMEGDFHIYFAPSVNVSGYGRTEVEAKESFDLGIELFCSDMLGISRQERDEELARFGFSRGDGVFLKNGVSGGYPLENARVSFVEVAA